MGLNTVAFTHAFIRNYVRYGDLCIDATAGRGRDTQLLCELVGPNGQVFAFDIQSEAVHDTQCRLNAAGLASQCRVIQDSHSNMHQYVQAETVRCIVFNFGYLPSGDHTVFTRPETSIPAIESGLSLLAPGGIMSLAIYYGGQTGYEERDALLSYLKTIDSKQYTVLSCNFINRPGDPPMPVFLWKQA